jgi:Asp-tRNA(Asn)/Glu-tRNA(Gln) amidotransferase A subunit family amidase
MYKHGFNVLRVDLSRKYEQLYNENRIDALIFPACPIMPVKLSDLNSLEKNYEYFELFIRNLSPGTQAEIPNISVPMRPANRQENQLPIGLSIEHIE